MTNSLPQLIQEMHRDARQHQRVLWVLVYCAVVICLVEYIFLPFRLPQVAPSLLRAAQGQWWSGLVPQLWWTGGTITLWVLIPLLIVRWQGIAWRDLGLNWRALKASWWIYCLMFLLMLPALLWASTQAGFQATYPLLRPRTTPNWSWTVLLLFWAMYVAQFFAVEFFFRGFIVFLLEKPLGLASIVVSVVPYCLIHLHKPLPEALGAIIAGLILGWLALKTRSIWGGVLLHASIALSMDALALWRTNAFPSL